MSLHTPDLTKFPPRSPRVRLGGYVILPRMLDKGRATLAGKNGEYHYACPLDQRFLEFTGIDPEALKKELGKSDGEISNGLKNAKHKRAPMKSPRGRNLPDSAPRGRGVARVFQRHPQDRPGRNARTSRRGLTCWTWTIMRASAARRDFRRARLNDLRRADTRHRCEPRRATAARRESCSWRSAMFPCRRFGRSPRWSSRR